MTPDQQRQLDSLPPAVRQDLVGKPDAEKVATVEAYARMDAYAKSPETKARHARTADMLERLFPNGGVDSSGNAVATMVGALRRAAR